MRIVSRKTGMAAAMIGISALALTACGAAPEETAPKAENPDYTGCIVSDSGGFDDQSFNESSYRGLKNARCRKRSRSPMPTSPPTCRA